MCVNIYHTAFSSRPYNVCIIKALLTPTKLIIQIKGQNLIIKRAVIGKLEELRLTSSRRHIAPQLISKI